MSLYCGGCYRSARETGGLAEGDLSCGRCGRSDLLRCTACECPVPIGMPVCTRCAGSVMVSKQAVASAGLSELPPLSAAGLLAPGIPAVPVVAERYSAGRFGITAEVTIPARDVELMNELGSLVSLLHVLASRLNYFTGHTDHTRKLIRDMRVLATDAQEEIELRRGPR